jgi:hypothetical protein
MKGIIRDLTDRQRVVVLAVAGVLVSLIVATLATVGKG